MTELGKVGCSMRQYSGNAAVFAIPKNEAPVWNKIKELDLSVARQCYFPLGSDAPVDELRHDSVRHGVKACNWLLFSIVPNELVEGVIDR